MNVTGTCQVCGRQIKLKNGKIARHGFNGMAGGMHTMACSGTNFEPYEESNQCLPLQVRGLQRDIELWENWIATKDLRPDRVKDLRKAIKDAQEFIPKLQKRFDDWKPA